MSRERRRRSPPPQRRARATIFMSRSRRRLSSTRPDLRRWRWRMFQLCRSRRGRLRRPAWMRRCLRLQTTRRRPPQRFRIRPLRMKLPRAVSSTNSADFFLRCSAKQSRESKERFDLKSKRFRQWPEPAKERPVSRRTVPESRGLQRARGSSNPPPCCEIGRRSDSAAGDGPRERSA